MVGILLNGGNQYLANSATPGQIGIEDEWSVSFWVKAFANPEFQTIFSTESRGRNKIEITAAPISDGRTSQLRAHITDAAGDSIKHYGWQGFFSTGWGHTVLTWDGTDLEAYVSGTLATTGTVFVNVTGTMSDDPERKIFYGATSSGVLATGSGIAGHLSIWNSVLASGEAAEIAAGGHPMDLTSNTGNYTSSANLQQYWKPGDDANDIGKNFASGSNINIGTDATNISSGNITSEGPYE